MGHGREHDARERQIREGSQTPPPDFKAPHHRVGCMRDSHRGSLPGVTPVKLSREPLGTPGELTPGPDNLNPEIPEHRRELESRGYLDSPNEEDVDELEDFGIGDDSNWGESRGLEALLPAPRSSDEPRSWPF